MVSLFSMIKGHRANDKDCVILPTPLLCQSDRMGFFSDNSNNTDKYKIIKLISTVLPGLVLNLNLYPHLPASLTQNRTED